jgi:hypothetical protein
MIEETIILMMVFYCTILTSKKTFAGKFISILFRSVLAIHGYDCARQFA